MERTGEFNHTLENLGEDMSRQAILERLGWRFVRIRGSEFFRDPEGAMRPVFERLQALEIPAEGIKTDEVSVKSTNGLEAVIFRRAAEIRRDWGMEPPLSDLVQTEELPLTQVRQQTEELPLTQELQQIEEQPITQVHQQAEELPLTQAVKVNKHSIALDNENAENTIPLVRRLGRYIPDQIKFQDKVMYPSTIPSILTSVLEELLILSPDIINNLDSTYPCRQLRFTYDSAAFPDYVKFEKLSNGMYVLSTSNVVRTIRMTYNILELCGYKKEDLRMIYE